MGVLEDAIREHLDLKRRHGASDEELNQQEAEALGPARRDDPETEPAEVEPHAEVGHAEVEPPAEVEPTAAPDEPEPAPAEVDPDPPAPADQDTVLYAPGEAPVAPEEDEHEDPDFGPEHREHGSAADPDFD